MSEDKKIRRKSMPWILAGLVVLAAIGVSAWWGVVVNALGKGVANWVDQQRAGGVTATYAGLRFSGWPLKVRAEVAKPKIVGPGYTWDGEAVVAEAPLWDLTSVALTLPGQQRLAFAGGGVAETTTGGRGVLRLPGAEPKIVGDVAFDRVELSGLTPEPATVERLHITAEVPASLVVGHQAPGLTLAVDAAGIGAGVIQPAAFAEGVHQAELKLRVMGAPARLDRDAIAAWSADGGTVEVDTLNVTWGPLGATINGTFALDTHLQPLVATTATLRGAAAAIDALGGGLSARDAQTARMVIAMLSKPAANGGEPVLQVPISVQDGFLYAGPVKLTRLPALAW